MEKIKTGSVFEIAEVVRDVPPIEIAFDRRDTIHAISRATPGPGTGRYRAYMEKIKTGSVFDIAEVLHDVPPIDTGLDSRDTIARRQREPPGATASRMGSDAATVITIGRALLRTYLAGSAQDGW